MGGSASSSNAVIISGKGLTQLDKETLEAAEKITGLDLSRNRIQSLPGKMPRLVSLNLAGNGIQELSEALISTLSGYASLEQLGLAENEITHYRNFLSGIASLKGLDVSKNGMSSVMVLNEKLEELNASRNFLSEFPEHLPKGLKVLNLDFNRISKLGRTMENLKSLTIAMNGMVEIEENVRFPSLLHLGLAKNDFMRLPNLRIVAPRLETLDVSDNILEELPILPATLIELDARRNKLKSLADLSKLTPKLERLDVSFNEIEVIRKLPGSLKRLFAGNNCISIIQEMPLARLTRLVLSDNLLVEVPKFYGNRLKQVFIYNNCLSSLDTFVWSNGLNDFRANGNRIQRIPLEMLKIDALRNLELADNQITEIPEEISMSKLETLNLSMNQLTGIPGLPASLKVLFVMGCGLKTLPASMMKGLKLEELYVSNNELQELPMIATLSVLRASRNKLKVFPPLGSLVKVADVSHNSITTFRKTFKSLGLVDLDLSHNKITKLPRLLLDCKELMSLDFSENEMNGVASFQDFANLERIVAFGIPLAVTASPATRMVLIGGGDQPMKPYDTQIVNRLAVRDAVSFSEMTGRRPSMQDMVVMRDNGNISTFAIFDGHSGNASAIYGAFEYSKLFCESVKATRGFMEQSIQAIVDRLKEMNVGGGSTASICIVSPTKIVTGQIGDSRVLVIEEDGSVSFSTTDHKPTDREELRRVMSAGGTITGNRLEGKLAVTRSLSDFHIDGVLRDPDVTVRVIDPNDKWLILACDGVFDVLSSEKIGRLSLKADSAANLAADVRNMAYGLGSTDNISVIAVDIQQLVREKPIEVASGSSSGSSSFS